MNRALLRLSLACLVMFVLLMINVNFVQAFQSTSLASKPGNVRVFNEQFQYQRGSILATGDGSNTIIARSKLLKGGNGTYHRVYTDGPVYAPVTGYDSVYGKTGIEASENKELSGTDPKLEVHNFLSLITGKKKMGASVSLTISARAQQAAYAALRNAGGHEAAVVAINPSTGAILAMASFPTYDPNVYTTFNGTKLNRVDKQLRKDPNEPLLNRALNWTLPPGSTFKIITSSAAFSEHKVAGADSPVPAPTDLSLHNGHFLINDNHEACGNGHPPIIEAFYLSCNTAFGALGMKVKGPALQKYASAYGFFAGSKRGTTPALNVPLSVTPSSMASAKDLADPAFTALSAIGQFDDRVTPLQEAMISAAVANHGTLMTPYLVQKVQTPDESTIDSATPTVLSRPISSAVASDLTKMMVQVTQNPAGTAYATANSNVVGVTVAGKTGTAQNGINNSGLNDAVFTCFAPADNPKIAVGVIVKGGGFGAAAAAPIAVKVIQAYLKLP